MSFPRDLSVEEADRMREIVHSFPERIGTMTECRIGADLTGARTHGYQYLLYTVFSDAEALATYVAHPRHQELVRFLDERDCQRLAFDYYLDETTDAFRTRGFTSP
jgi:hypothetical protein